MDFLENWVQEKIGFDVNEMYVKEAGYFLECLKNRKKPSIDLEQGEKTLRLALAIKESSEKRRFVSLS